MEETRVITSDKLLASMRQRMTDLVERSDYSLREKRIRAMAQLERVLEVVVKDLPQERREVVQEMLSLYDKLWRL